MRFYAKLVAALLSALLLLGASHVRADACVWSFEAQEGKAAYYTLTPKWSRSCAVPIQYSVTSGNGAYFTSSTSNRLYFSAAETGLVGSRRYESVQVSVTCDGVPLCPWSMVYFSITPADALTTTTTTTTSQAPQTSTTTTTTAPGPVVCTPPEPVMASVATRTPLHVLSSVQNCAAPKLSITQQTGTSSTGQKLFTVAADGTDVIFDADATNTKEGVFTASVLVTCPLTGSTCVLSERVIASTVPTVTPSVAPASCARPYIYNVGFLSVLQGTVAVHEEDALLCPSGAAVFVYSDVTLPTYNSDQFHFSTTAGTFSYSAPAGPLALQDSFTFVIRCGESAADVTNSVPLCVAHASIMISDTTGTTTTTTVSPGGELPQCPGNYGYRLELNSDGTGSAKGFNLLKRFAPLTGDGAFCPTGVIRAVDVTSHPTSGTLTGVDADTGDFVYTPAAKPATGEAADTFNFTLTCSSTPEAVCAGQATISIDPAPSDEIYTVYHDTIMCRGTCDSKAWKSTPDYVAKYFETDLSPLGDNSHITPRKDDHDLDGVEFEITNDGKLRIRAFTTIGNLAARFVTFSPLNETSVANYFTSGAVPDGAHVSFEPSCLDKQANYGVASDIWTWTNKDRLEGHLNTETESYKSGENYFQKFGGNHRGCDVYREDPCKYAPLLTPSLVEGNADVMDWKLYINDCDATWVGEASVETLRALRLPSGAAVFTLVSTNQLEGYVYSQSVKPERWAPPYRGVATSLKAYKLSLTIMNTLIIEAQADLLPTASPTDIEMSSDIQFALAKDPKTSERVYAYHLVLYPYTMTAGTVTAVNTTKTTITSYDLINATWRSPSKAECPECVGTETFCVGTGKGLASNCTHPLLSLEPLDEKTISFDTNVSSVGGSSLFPSTSYSSRSFYDIYLAARANGEGSAASTDGSPVGVFWIDVKLSNGQSFNVMVNQTDYVSEINTRFIATRLYRPSAYWPVPDALGSSVPIHPFNGTSLAHVTSASGEASSSSTAAAAYGGPIPLSDSCSFAPHDIDAATHITLKNHANLVQGVNLSMTAMEDERTYGVTDWVMMSFPSLHEETKLVHNANSQLVIDDPTLSDKYFTVAELQYLTLSVSASETVASDDDELLHFLLDGSNPPAVQLKESTQWMYPGLTTDSDTIDYLPWSEYASFINYRRISFDSVPSTTQTSQIVVEPFNFAFIPGTLLYKNSSTRVPIYVRGSIKFTTYAETSDNSGEVVKVGDREEQLYYIISVSRAISASVRFDNDVYTPPMVTIRTGGLNKTSATVLLIILVVAVVAVLAVSIYIEVIYKRIIHNAKYHPKRPESAVGIRYGRDGKPKNADATIVDPAADASAGKQQHSPLQEVRASPPPAAATDGASAVKGGAGGIKTKFGVVQAEQARVRDGGDSETPEQGRTSPAPGTSSSPAQGEDGSIGEEQDRVSDTSVADL